MRIGPRRARAGLVPASRGAGTRARDRSAASRVAAQCGARGRLDVLRVDGRAARAGIVMMQADGKTVALLGASLPAFVAVDKAWAHRLEDIHEWLGNAMIVLIGVHVGATLWHRIVATTRSRGCADVIAAPGLPEFRSLDAALRVQQPPAAERPVLPLRFLEHDHHVLGIEPGSRASAATMSATTLRLTFTLRPTDHRISISAKSSVRGRARDPDSAGRSGSRRPPARARAGSGRLRARPRRRARGARRRERRA